MAIFVALAWSSGASLAYAEDVSRATPCMTTSGDLSVPPALPPSRGETDLWCEDAGDPRCSVGIPRGGETDSLGGATTSAGTLSSAAWPRPAVMSTRFGAMPCFDRSDGVASRIDRPPRRA